MHTFTTYAIGGSTRLSNGLGRITERRPMQIATTADNKQILFHADGDVTGADGRVFARSNYGTAQGREAARLYLIACAHKLTFDQAVKAWRKLAKS